MFTYLTLVLFNDLKGFGDLNHYLMFLPIVNKTMAKWGIRLVMRDVQMCSYVLSGWRRNDTFFPKKSYARTGRCTWKTVVTTL